MQDNFEWCGDKWGEADPESARGQLCSLTHTHTCRHTHTHTHTHMRIIQNAHKCVWQAVKFCFKSRLRYTTELWNFTRNCGFHLVSIKKFRGCKGRLRSETGISPLKIKARRLEDKEKQHNRTHMPMSESPKHFSSLLIALLCDVPWYISFIIFHYGISYFWGNFTVLMFLIFPQHYTDRVIPNPCLSCFFVCLDSTWFMFPPFLSLHCSVSPVSNYLLPVHVFMKLCSLYSRSVHCVLLFLCFEIVGLMTKTFLDMCASSRVFPCLPQAWHCNTNLVIFK